MKLRGRILSLRLTVAATTALAAVLALLTAAALVVLSTVLEQTTTSVSNAVESVRLAGEAELHLLLHGRSRDPLVRSNLAEDLRRRLESARSFVSTEEEARALGDAEIKVERYLESARPADIPAAAVSVREEAAYHALKTMVEVNVEQARRAQERASRLNGLANSMGFLVAALLIGLGAPALLWFRRKAFAPIFSLASAMDRFAKGDREVRADEVGPHELREMSRRFNEMAAALAAERHAQMSFLAGIAHDLRNPISVLKLAAAIGHKDRPLPPEPRLRQVMQKIEHQISRLDRMVGDLLDTAKIEAGELEVRLDNHDARALVTDALQLFEGAASEHSIDVALPEQPVPVCCDPLRIEQVITNLVSNAIKYSPAGTHIDLALEAQDGQAVIRVRDQGVGIAQEDQRRLFEPFRRVGLSKDAVPGAGLGLFVVRRILEAHGGKIEVESVPGEGSTFRACLPLRACVSDKGASAAP